MTTRQKRAATLWAVLLTTVLAHPAQAEYDYMDDANRRSPTKDSSLPSLRHDFPRVLTHEMQTNTSVQAYSKYDFITTKGQAYPNVERLQRNFSPDTMVLRHISGRAYQSFNYEPCSISGGVAFETTTNRSQGGPYSAGCGIYAGHWLYKAGTTLRKAVNAGATTLPIANASRIQRGQYVVIYDAPAGSFRNAEHARVTAVNQSAGTIEVVRGYKSQKVFHSAGSIVAQHVLGQGHQPELWAYNMTSKSPTDNSGRTFGEFYADWLQKNLLRYGNGTRTSASIAGVMFDADFYFYYSGTGVDANNDLVTDEGIGSSGQNWLGEGLDDFYRRVSNRLPGHYVLVGVHDARGFDTAHGGQMENWLDYGNGDFDPNPKYTKFSKLFTSYLFNMGERAQGPALVMNLTKTPTQQYPGGTNASSNSAFRLGFAMTLMEDGYFGTHTAKEPDAWWDEYAVETRRGASNFGAAIDKNDIDAIHAHRGWLGEARGTFRRIYSEGEFAPSKSLIGNNTFDRNLNGWAGSNLSISRATWDPQDGAGSLRASPMNRYSDNEMGAFVRSEKLNVVRDNVYTVVFSAKAATTREIRVSLGKDSYRIPVSAQWRRYVLTFSPAKSETTALKFGLGREDSAFWLDSAYVFRGNANIFQREFANGMALANATGQTRTINIGPGFRRIKGKQDRLNNGNAATSVTLAPYDGIILVRDDSVEDPGSGGDGGGSRIGDYVWRDEDGDGRQDSNESGWTGITVRLRECNGSVIATTKTNSNGRYVFTDVANGSYQVEFSRPSGTRFSPYQAGSGSAGNSDADPSTGRSWCVNIKSAGQTSFGIDAGLVPAGASAKTSGGSGTIGDYVWKDKDGDGRQDGGEPGVGGVKVQLRDCGGLWLQNTFTANDGSYLFEDLADGDYMLRFVAPSGTTFTRANAGSDGSSDSNADAAGWSQCVKVQSGSSHRWIDAGLKY